MEFLGYNSEFYRQILTVTQRTALISPLSIAPMIDWSYTHFRVLMRLMAPNALLYTEMQTLGAIKHNPSRALFFNPSEHPLALQLGGSDKEGLILCAKMAEEQGFAEINLNLGCPSDKVQAGRFGACLMKEPAHVADCIAGIKKAVSIPVTAKTRIGIDEQDSYAFFSSFAHTLVNAGCDKLIVHARKAWLRGLNPKQNRTIPPLHYDYVYRLKEELNDLPVVINGNIQTITEIEGHLHYADGVMLGRLACQNPYALAEIHRFFYPSCPTPAPSAVLSAYQNYIEEQYAQKVPLTLLLKPIFNFAHGLSFAKRWKEDLTQIQRSKNITHLKNSIFMFY